jgi:hypothetical protein
MRRILTLVVAGFVLQASGAQGRAESHQPTVSLDDALAGALWRIAAATGTRVGFEATSHVLMGGRMETVPTVAISTTPSAVLVGLRNFIYTSTFSVDPRPSSVDRPVSFDLSSGTVIDALNGLMVAADHVLWVVSCRAMERSAQRFADWELSLQVRDARHTTAWSASQPRVVK